MGREGGVSDGPEHLQADPSRGGGRDGPARGWGNSRGTWGSSGVPKEPEGEGLVLERLPQRADGKFLLVPAAEQHWLLHQKPSRQETAESVAHRYSVAGRLLRRSLKQPSVPLSGILYVG